MKRQFESIFLLQFIFKNFTNFKLGCVLLGATAYDQGPTGLRALKPGEGIESVPGFCQGLNGLDEFSDIATQLMNFKYPQLGPFRVSCWIIKY